MTIRVAINGFGRIGRLAFRAAWAGAHPGGKANIRIAHVNEPKCDAAMSAYLLTFDSVHGRWAMEAKGRDGAIAIGDETVGYSQAASPGEVDWKGLGIDLVLDCSGKFKTTEKIAPYFERGVRKVVVSAPVKTGALNVVMGVNERLYDPGIHDIVTAASCTTNCLAPVVKVVHEGIGIRHGMITTVHNATNTQSVIDRPDKDIRRARSGLLNLIPTTTGSATAIGLIFPELVGKLDGIAVRVPLLNASITDCVFEVSRPTTVEQVNGLLRKAADGPLAGILGYEERPLVSTDFRGDIRSSIVDSLSTKVTNGTQVKILAWYDNEMGYAHRMIELARMVAGSIGAAGSATARNVAARS